jgi:lipoyl(octanoyl) transferase
MHLELGRSVDENEVKEKVKKHLAELFEMEIEGTSKDIPQQC